MKQLFILLTFAVTILNGAMAQEKVTIVEPMIKTPELKLERVVDGVKSSISGLSSAKTSGEFIRSFESKEECVAWVRATIDKLVPHVIIFSASCEKERVMATPPGFPPSIDWGIYHGEVTYL